MQGYDFQKIWLAMQMFLIVSKSHSKSNTKTVLICLISIVVQKDVIDLRRCTGWPLLLSPQLLYRPADKQIYIVHQICFNLNLFLQMPL